jgi:excisionase family DNA binding protein
MLSSMASCWRTAQTVLAMVNVLPVVALVLIMSDVTPPDGMAATPPSADDMTPAEAAARLGISERTVQRRLKQGTLKGYKVDTGRGEVWRVVLDDMAATAPAPDVMTPVSPRHDDVMASSVAEFAHAVIDELRDEYRDEIERLRRENQQLAGQLGFTQAKLQEAEKQIALLMAPKDEPESAPPAEPARVSWWKRWLRG